MLRLQLCTPVLGFPLAFFCSPAVASEVPVVSATLSTAPLHRYENAPAAPDADDPAIWVHPNDPSQSLVIATAKDAGLLIYNLQGALIQAILPPHAPHVDLLDPPTPGGVHATARACPESASGETFGRFNNVDIAYGMRVGSNRHAAPFDVAVVSDRGCDRLRFYRIYPDRPDAPLVDVTSANTQRIFSLRNEESSIIQGDGSVSGWINNPLDDQKTGYGLAVAPIAGTIDVFVSQRESRSVQRLALNVDRNGKIDYLPKQTLVFDTNFTLSRRDHTTYSWSPCREDLNEEPQAEGMVYDPRTQRLFVGFETLGLYAIAPGDLQGEKTAIGREYLLEPLTTFGTSYWIEPDGDGFACHYSAQEAPAPDAVFVAGSNEHAGRHLNPDLEGVTVLGGTARYTLLLASSQGDSTFHLYDVPPERRKPMHLAAFAVQGVNDTDGVHVAGPLPGTPYSWGLLVVQNGDAPQPPDLADIHGYAYDGSTQFKFVHLSEVWRALWPL